jgi:hypothetical protein
MISAEEPEHDVRPDPRSPSISENPPRTLDIIEARDVPGEASPSVTLHGLEYALQPEVSYHRNRKVFGLLYQLFQMNVASAESAGPAITIAK